MSKLGPPQLQLVCVLHYAHGGGRSTRQAIRLTGDKCRIQEELQDRHPQCGLRQCCSRCFSSHLRDQLGLLGIKLFMRDHTEIEQLLEILHPLQRVFDGLHRRTLNRHGHGSDDGDRRGISG